MGREIERYSHAVEQGGEVIEGELVEERAVLDEGEYCEECGHYHRAYEGCRPEASCGDYRCCH